MSAFQVVKSLVNFFIQVLSLDIYFRHVSIKEAQPASTFDQDVIFWYSSFFFILALKPNYKLFGLQMNLANECHHTYFIDWLFCDIFLLFSNFYKAKKLKAFDDNDDLPYLTNFKNSRFCFVPTQFFCERLGVFQKISDETRLLCLPKDH